MALHTRSEPKAGEIRPAGTSMIALAWVLALGSVAFAVVNAVFEVTGRFAEGPWADYSAAISIINWFVAGVKIVGAAVALLSVASRPPLAPRAVNFSIWGAAGVLAVYALGSLGQAIGFVLGPDGANYVDVAGILYVILFLLAAAGFVTLAASHTKRFGMGPAPAIIGALGGLVLLGFILLILPAILSALGVMPST